MTTTKEHIDRCSKCGRPFEAHLACAMCGRAMQQPEDPGSYREYCSNACRQRAYRARGGRASGTRQETPGARRRREEREAWAEAEARRERERQRSQQRRQAPREEPREKVPGWVYESDSDPRAAKRRRTCRLLWERAAHGSTPPHEAQACKERADEIRRRYGL